MLRSQTLDASSHTNYLFQFLKSGRGAKPRQTAKYAAFPVSVNSPEQDILPNFVTVSSIEKSGTSQEGAQYSGGSGPVNTP